MATVRIQLWPGNAEFPATNGPQRLNIQGTNHPVPVLAFDAATDESAYFTVRLADYVGTTLQLGVDIVWGADSATSGDVVWGMQIQAITPNTDSTDPETDGFDTAGTVTDSHLGTTAGREHLVALEMGDTDTDGAVDGDVIKIRIYRDADNGSDTLAGDAYIYHLWLTYSDD
jgi:hypothetical protein